MVRRVAAAIALGAGALALAMACSQSGQPIGRGDDLTQDVPTPTATAPQSEDAGGDSPFAPLGDAYGPPLDGYAPLAWCATCACPSGTYCFGGATGHTRFSGDAADCKWEDAGPDAALEIGCHEIPDACAKQATCACILQQVSGDFGCYGVCAQKSGFTVYCPSP